MNTSNTNHMPWCTDHAGGGLCQSKTWTVASLRLRLFGCDTDVPPVHVDVRMPPPATGLGYSTSEVGRLADAFHALAMLADDARETARLIGRLDELEDAS